MPNSKKVQVKISDEKYSGNCFKNACMKASPYRFFLIPIFAALLAFILIVFAVRANSGCVQTFSSVLGTIQTFSIKQPKISLNYGMGIPRIDPANSLVSGQRAILIDPQGNALTIVHSPSLDLTSFNGQTVILTGTLSECTRSIVLDSLQNLSPIFSGSPVQAPTVSSGSALGK